jgi:deoxyribonuclease-4
MIGCHINSDISTLIEEVINVYNNGGKVIQLFTNIGNKKAINVYKKLNIILKEKNMICIVHASYTINCAQNWTFHSWWIKQFIIEIEHASLIGASCIVIHMGKELDLTSAESINNMYTSLLFIHEQTKEHSNIKILLETSTGQGSEMCYKLDKLAYFYKKLSNNKNKIVRERFGICVDTCHIFEAGYDIRGTNHIKTYIKKFDDLIGIKNIKLIHLNDSKKEIGLKVDRHANIGEGYIGEDSLIYFALYFYKKNIPIILETPHDKIIDDMKKILYKMK